MIAVTGASGHLGQWVVAALGAARRDVMVIARRPITSPTIAGLTWPRPVRTLACDLAAPGAVAALEPALADAEAIVHLAARISSASDDDASAAIGANVHGTIALLAAARHIGAVVYASTFEVYGTPIRLPVGEDHPTRPLGYYGATKLAAEKYVALFANETGVPAATLRMPAIYGPGDTQPRALTNFLRAAARGEPLEIHGDGADLRELLYVEDAAAAVLRALERRASGVFNIGSGRGISIREMAETVAHAAGGADIAWRDRDKPRHDWVLDVDRARRELGWLAAVPLDEGVARALQWTRVATVPA